VEEPLVEGLEVEGRVEQGLKGLVVAAVLGATSVLTSPLPMRSSRKAGAGPRRRGRQGRARAQLARVKARLTWGLHGSACRFSGSETHAAFKNCYFAIFPINGTRSRCRLTSSMNVLWAAVVRAG
jgi:hypothetical protein